MDEAVNTRVATVGVATFTVSFFAVLWVVMIFLGRLTRQRWMTPVGFVMLAIVVIVFSVAPRETPVKSESTWKIEEDYSSYVPRLAVIATILILSTIGAVVFDASTSLSLTRRAKIIES